jgi:hypothetical protein
MESFSMSARGVEQPHMRMNRVEFGKDHDAFFIVFLEEEEVGRQDMLHSAPPFL